VLILAAAAVWTPLAFGASGTWARFGAELTATAATSLWALGAARPFWLTAAPLVMTALLLAQLGPLPESLLVQVAPISAGAWKVATAGVGSSRSCVSVDPAATWAGIQTVLVLLAATATVIDLGRLQQQRRILLGAVAVSGLLILAIGGIGGRIGENQLLLGFIDISGPILPTRSPINLPAQSNGVGIAEWVEVANQRYQSDEGWIGGCVGLFLYGNHFAAAVCLTLPVMLSVWLWLTAERIPGWLQWGVAAITTSAAIWAVAWVAGSRAGTGALALTIVTFLSLVAPLRWMRIASGLVAFVLAVGVAIFSALILLPTDTVMSVVPPDSKQTVARLLADGRAGPAHVAIRAFLASPMLGTGLDTFRDIFPRFYTDRFTLFYAHNEFAQLLAETGLLGVAFVTAFVWYLTPKAVRFWRDAPGHYRVLNAGPWAGLAGITAHSAFDWDLHLPAIAILTVIVVGLAASSVPAPKPTGARKPLIPEYVPRWLLVVCCVIATAGLWRDAISESVQRQLREAIVADRLAEKDPKRPDATEALALAIFAGESLARFDPNDADLLVTIGQANLHLARLNPPGEERNLLLGNAERWFQRARKASAMCRGLPEPVPNAPPGEPATSGKPR